MLQEPTTSLDSAYSEVQHFHAQKPWRFVFFRSRVRKNKFALPGSVWCFCGMIHTLFLRAVVSACGCFGMALMNSLPGNGKMHGYRFRLVLENTHNLVSLLRNDDAGCKQTHSFGVSTQGEL